MARRSGRDETAAAGRFAMTRAKRLALVLLPSFLLLTGAETLLRVLEIPSEKYLARRFAFPPPELFGKAFQEHPLRFWSLVPGYDGPWELFKVAYTHERIRPDVGARSRSFPDFESYYGTVTWDLNEAGFRGQRRAGAPQIILFVGSSVTFGWGVRSDDSFVGLLRDRLIQSELADWDVVNAGVPGYSSYQVLVYLREIVATLKPALIIAEAGINDGVWAPGLSDRDARIDEPRNRWLGWLATHSNIVQAAHQALRGSTSATVSASDHARFYYTSLFVPDHTRVPEAEFRRNIDDIESLAAEVGAPVFFLFPGLYNEYGEGRLVKSVRFEHPREIDIVAAIQSAAGEHLADFFIPYDEGHPSRQGHQRIAEQIWARLAADGILPDSANPAPADRIH